MDSDTFTKNLHVRRVGGQATGGMEEGCASGNRNRIDSTSGTRNGDKAHSVGIFTDDHSGPENGRIHKKQLIGDDGRNEGGGVHGNDHRHDATTTGNKPTATQISTYQRLLNITGGMLVFASNYAQDCIAIISGNYETGPLRA